MPNKIHALCSMIEFAAHGLHCKDDVQFLRRVDQRECAPVVTTPLLGTAERLMAVTLPETQAARVLRHVRPAVLVSCSNQQFKVKNAS